MKRPLAYLTAAWSGEPDVDMELAAHYCRLAYEAGFSPIWLPDGWALRRPHWKGCLP